MISWINLLGSFVLKIKVLRNCIKIFDKIRVNNIFVIKCIVFPVVNESVIIDDKSSHESPSSYEPVLEIMTNKQQEGQMNKSSMAIGP